MGAWGCLKERSNAEEFIKAIRALSKNEIWAGRRLITKALNQLLHMRQFRLILKPKFTAREEEIVKSVLQGCSNKQIAKNLSLSEKTIKAYLTNIFKKLGVSRRLDIFLNLSGESTYQPNLTSTSKPSLRDIAVWALLLLEIAKNF